MKSVTIYPPRLIFVQAYGIMEATDGNLAEKNMLYEFHSDESHGTKITAKERNLLIRDCLSVGTRATCSTAALVKKLREIAK